MAEFRSKDGIWVPLAQFIKESKEEDKKTTKTVSKKKTTKK